MRRLVILFAAVLGGCYAPPAFVDDCNVQCGGGATGMECPADTTCGVDGFCHPEGSQVMCGSPPATFAALDTGYEYACGIEGGKLYCWGRNDYGQLGVGDTEPRDRPTRVGDPTWEDWVDVSAGGDHTCGLRTGGALYCWGTDGQGQLGDGPGTGPGSVYPEAVATDKSWARISVGDSHTCGIIDSGFLYCWGANQSGQLGIAVGDHDLKDEPTKVDESSWDQISAGFFTTCGLKMDGTRWCWGGADEGELGLGMTMMQSDIPATPPTEGAGWSKIVVGTDHACGLRNGGEVWCWGRNSSGQIGEGGQANAYDPVKVGFENGWGDVAVGQSHTCGVHDGALRCWGYNAYGQLGNGGRATEFEPQPSGMGQTWATVTAAEHFTCARTTGGQVYCFGLNNFGQLGEGQAATKRRPVQVGSMTGWTAVALGWSHSCGLRGSELWCWGLNDEGELGVGDAMDRYTPTQVPGSWLSVSLGRWHTCAIAMGGQMKCWGANQDSQLGRAADAGSTAPVNVLTGKTFTTLSAGAGNTCGVADGLWCWGENEWGQSGTGLTGPDALPTMIDGMQFGSLSGAWLATCGIRADDELLCWGVHDIAQIPDGVMTPPDTVYDTPMVVPNLPAGLGQVTLGDDHGCFTTTTGELWCWGRNAYGEVGNGVTDQQDVPVRVLDDGSGHTWTLANGGGHATMCAIREDDLLFCWGDGEEGQLGEPTYASLLPLQPGDDAATWSYVAQGWSHTCGIQTDGTLWCWGDNAFGQLGDGSGSRTSPVAVAAPE